MYHLQITKEFLWKCFKGNKLLSLLVPVTVPLLPETTSKGFTENDYETNWKNFIRVGILYNNKEPRGLSVVPFVETRRGFNNGTGNESWSDENETDLMKVETIGNETKTKQAS